MQLPNSTLAWVHQGLAGSTEPTREGAATSHTSFSSLLKLQERPLPRLKFGEVLVRVEAAPVNPSDQLFVQGKYGFQPQTGDVPGFEGCGTVLAANVGPYGWWLRGKRVSFGGQDGNGSWAQYAVLSAFTCIPVDRKLPTEAAATLIVNPMTAFGLLAQARRHGTQAIVVNAAGSALGKYLIALARLQRLEVIALVRKEAAIAPLKSLGASEVLNTNGADFLPRLSACTARLQARVLLDAVAGERTAALMRALPEGSLAIVYGKLDDAARTGELETVAIDVNGLVFRNQRVEGYWLTHELHGLRGVATPLWRARQIGKLYRRGIFTSGPFLTTSLAKLAEVLESQSGSEKILYTAAASDSFAPAVHSSYAN